MGQKVLVVDDEKLIVKGIRFSLEQDGMEVDCAYDGEEALELARHNTYDMVLLDVMLPKMTGFEVCQQIREFSNVPIVMLTAKGEDMDKILGLEYGADDYITKPFNILEVKARIKAIMRRTARSGESRESAKVVEKGGMRLVCDSRRVYIDGKEIKQGDFMGIGDKGILSVGIAISEVTMQMIDEMMSAERELISIYYGSEIQEEDAESLRAQVESKYPECDIELQYGGQPIYYYIVSAE